MVAPPEAYGPSFFGVRMRRSLAGGSGSAERRYAAPRQRGGCGAPLDAAGPRAPRSAEELTKAFVEWLGTAAAVASPGWSGGAAARGTRERTESESVEAAEAARAVWLEKKKTTGHRRRVKWTG